MEPRKVDTQESIAWYTGGWRLFVKYPGLWVIMTLIFFLIGMVLSFIPLVGALTFALIGPALYAGLLHGARESDRGRSLDLSHLFVGLTDADKRGPLLTLGACALVAQIGFSAIILGLVFSRIGATGFENPDLMALGGGAVIGLIIILILATLVTMALLYAAPLVYLTGLDPIAAIKSSFNACLRNFAPLTLAGIIYLVLAMICAATFGLGFLIVFPLTICAIYLSYKGMFDT